MNEIRRLTVTELAEDAFLKNERLQMLSMMNTPIEYESRKKAFIEMALAREAANEAQAALEAATRPRS